MNKVFKRLWRVCFGLMCLVGGMLFWIDPDPVIRWKVYDYFSVKEGKWGIVFGFISVGLLSMYSGLKKTIIDYEEALICPKCETTFKRGDVHPECRCNTCDMPLEPMKGYYDRHPERKEGDFSEASE